MSPKSPPVFVPTKACRKCARIKPSESFPRDGRSRDGRSNRCNECAAKASQEWYRDKRNQEGKEYVPNLTKWDWLKILARGSLACRSCKIEKSLAAFPRSMRPPYLRRICRDCYYAQKKDCEKRRQQHVREYHKKYRCKQYGLTIADYDAMLELQHGKCPICDQLLGAKGQTIDHDHKTGKVRGIVHSRCNLVIGNASEDISVLVGAIRYLIAHRGNTGHQQTEATPVTQSKGADIGGETRP